MIDKIDVTETADGRRIFYVDVGDMSPTQAQEILEKFRVIIAESRKLT
jgi:hypothetical protein